MIRRRAAECKVRQDKTWDLQTHKLNSIYMYESRRPAHWYHGYLEDGREGKGRKVPRGLSVTI